MIHLHPEGLRVPAWVAYVAAAAFVLAGLCLFAGALEIDWLQQWLGIAVTLSMLVVSLWIAFGPGERECSMSIPFVQTVAPDALCRGAFGIGALLVALFIGVFVRRALSSGS
jgi:cytosine/uracil/thiamine/allantoin permease